MTIQDKSELIIKDIKLEKGTNPIQIFKKIAQKEYVSMHGPEHHILDGASLLVAYKNAGGNIDIENALEKLMSEGLRMPGAMCGLWGICGAITSIEAEEICNKFGLNEDEYIYCAYGESISIKSIEISII